MFYRKYDSSTIEITFTLTKLASSIYISVYIDGAYINSKTFSGDIRKIYGTNARLYVEYTVNIQANYVDGTSATTTEQMMIT